MKDRTARQSFLGATSDVTLSALRVAIVGLGGGGSHIVQQLAHIGVGAFVLIDADRIESSNLNRLIGGTVADVRARRWKTSISARLIRAVNPTATALVVRQKWQFAAEVLRDCDIIFGCVDSFGERRQLEEAARRYLIPYVDIGMDVLSSETGFHIVGQVALSMPGRACLRCMGIVRETDLAEEALRYGAAGGKPQVVWPNGVLASAATAIAIQLVCPWNADQSPPVLLEYDGNRNTFLPSAVVPLLPPRCSHYDGVQSVGDPWFARPHFGSHRKSRRRGC
jgi:hypothetical protein